MDNRRVVLANAPRSYRESLAAAFKRLRPQVSFITAEPAELDGVIRQEHPHLVVCSSLSTTIEQHTRAWIVLPPDGQSSAVLHATGEVRLLGALDLAGLLAVIDHELRLTSSEMAAPDEF